MFRLNAPHCPTFDRWRIAPPLRGEKSQRMRNVLLQGKNANEDAEAA